MEIAKFINGGFDDIEGRIIAGDIAKIDNGITACRLYFINSGFRGFGIDIIDDNICALPRPKPPPAPVTITVLPLQKSPMLESLYDGHIGHAAAFAHGL